MWLRWFPWRFFLSRFARAKGFVDPVTLMARLHRFAQPSEVAEPIELLRAGVIFHARGLINARAIQHNLDWVWPFWIERQFDPRDSAFVPRAFSITHVNLTHRNWTAVGQPDVDWMPLVDPRGLVTPIYDGWSLDSWIIPDEGDPLLPSRARRSRQRLELEPNLAVRTESEHSGHRLEQTAQVVWDGAQPECRVDLTATGGGPGWLVAALRPANPEGIAFVHKLRWEAGSRVLRVNGEADVRFGRSPDRVCMSRYRSGDVLEHLGPEGEQKKMSCEVGMASAAVMFRLGESGSAEVRVSVPLLEAPSRERSSTATQAVLPDRPVSWKTALAGRCEAKLPEPRLQKLYDIAASTLVLHSPGDVYPGPYTYKRFWFRDAAFILDALLAMGLFERVERTLELFPERQSKLGYFHSQEGEWDSNGEALWIMERYARLSGKPLSPRLVRSAVRGARWIRHKRLRDDLDAPHAGLLPAGFSAEHLGPNDYYYWDDFWSAAGLRSAARLLREADEPLAAEKAEAEADKLLAAVDRSLEQTAPLRDRPGVPASPYRRMDPGAIGSLVAGYPLQLWAPDDERLLDTAEFLRKNCLVHGGFFQDMIHSGINAYLTLHMAQVLLRAGDERHFDLVRAAADAASSTGQWPEAIHPHTGGGCMGDGQHVWAAAEWVLMIRSLFLREEAGRVILGSGIPRDWLDGRSAMNFGPAPTSFGELTLQIEPGEDEVVVSWEGRWRAEPPEMEIALPGLPTRRVSGEQGGVTLSRAHGEARGAST